MSPKSVSRSVETKRRILQAALEEFSAYGMAGARVDRIAANVGCNKNLIYIYFESKETLFTTVLRDNLTRVYSELEFTPGDLPGYAERIFDFAMANPDLMRLMAWFGLEQNLKDPSERDDAIKEKLTMISDRRDDGAFNPNFSAPFILTVIMTVATAWSTLNPFGRAIGKESAETKDDIRAQIARMINYMARPART